MGNGFKPFQTALAVDENTGELTAEAMSEELIICPDCHGRRLNPIALNVRFKDKSIADVAAMTIGPGCGLFQHYQAFRP